MMRNANSPERSLKKNWNSPEAGLKKRRRVKLSTEKNEVSGMSETNEAARDMYLETAEALLKLISLSPDCFHVADNLKTMLDMQGFSELRENERWELQPGRNYYVMRNGSSLIAFRLPGPDFRGFRIIASHSDSPSFKIKENPELPGADCYVRLNTERYGGMLMAPWFDRPLSAAGRVFAEVTDAASAANLPAELDPELKKLLTGKKRIEQRLVNIDRDLLMIPSLAIHMDRSVNEGKNLNPQKDMLPLLGSAETKGRFAKIVAEAAGVAPEQILSSDLYLYDRTAPSVWGADREFISSPRLDDLECAFCTFFGFQRAVNDTDVPVYALFDNEEVGSSTRQGAASTFLKDTLQRIGIAMGRDAEQYYTAIADSFMISADNGHAVHPNLPEKADPVNRPVMNGGIVLKYSANQKYTTDAASAAVVRKICRDADIPCQTFTNRSDIPGGSTLGNISGNQVPVRSADIGLAQLAMHSPYETGGVKDPEYLRRFAEAFYNAVI